MEVAGGAVPIMDTMSILEGLEVLEGGMEGVVDRRVGQVLKERAGERGLKR
jgi:hypothetical protein